MLAYKFRSPSQLDYALDIIFEKRLHCSDWEELNDPMEGIFKYSYRSPEELARYKRLVEILRRGKKHLLISPCLRLLTPTSSGRTMRGAFAGSHRS
jgi:hypothetical protein